MFPLENYLFSATGPKPNQDTIPAGVTLAGGFGFCFQCQVGSSLVLHRPIEITRLIRHLELISPMADITKAVSILIRQRSCTRSRRFSSVGCRGGHTTSSWA